MASSSLIGALRVTLGLDSAEFTRGTKKAQAQMTGFQKSMVGVGNGIKAAFVGLIGASALSAFSNMAKRGLEHASALGEQAQQLGVTTAALQEYRYAATQTGIAQEQMDMALSKGTRSLGEAAAGAKAPLAAFDALGVKIRDSAGNVRNFGDLMPQIAEGLRGVASPAERAALLVDIFGKAGQKLEPLLSGGAKGVNSLRDAANNLGLVLSDDYIARADKAADKISEFNQILASQEAIFASENADLILRYEQSINELKIGFMKAIPAIDEFLKNMDRISYENGDRIRKSINDQVDLFKYLAQSTRDTVKGWASSISTWYADLSVKAVANISAMVSGIRKWISGTLGGIWDGAIAKIKSVVSWFDWMDNEVVRNSYVPDMVDSIGDHIKRLDTKMVTPVKNMTKKSADSFNEMRAKVSSILANLYPDAAQKNQLLADIELLNKAFKAGEVDARTYSAAVEKLYAQIQVLDDNKSSGLAIDGGDILTNSDGDSIATAAMDELLKSLPQGRIAVKRTFEDIARSVEVTAGTVANAIGDMQSAFGGFVNSIKKGDILGILGGLANTISSVLGAFGKGGSLSNLFNKGSGAKVPGYATGTSFHPGGLAMVGERGRELVNLPRGSSVIPNGSTESMMRGGRTIVEIRPSPYFDGHVDGRAARITAAAAGPIAQAGSGMAQQQLMKRSGRRL